MREKAEYYRMATDHHYRHRLRIRRRRPTCCILSLLLLCCITLFIFIYRRSAGRSISALFPEAEDKRPVRRFAIELHPKDHTQRLPTSLTHHWNITKGIRAPDGVEKIVYLINGDFPGPTLEARTGDQLVVVVSNQLDGEEGVAIHWHGIHMQDANDMDGVIGVTQKVILPGEQFTYEFVISKTQAGTFWYHAHSELQRADGLYGGLVIHRRFEKGFSEPDEYQYKDEQLLLVGDWYHRSAVDVQASYFQSNSSKNEPFPESLLINGLGNFNCSLANQSQPETCKDVRTPSWKVSPRATRLRVVNVGATSGVNIALQDFNMKVIKIDGGNDIQSSDWVASVGILYPGERMDVVTSGDPGTSLTITLDPGTLPSKTPPTQTFPIENAHKHGSGFRKTHPQNDQKHTYNVSTPFDLSISQGPELQEPLPETANQTILLYIHGETLGHDGKVTAGYVNGTTWIPQVEPLISVPREEWDEHQFVPYVPATGGWVDIVVNNVGERGYTFHLHGNDFHVLARHVLPRNRTDNPFASPPHPSPPDALALYPKPNLDDPVSKDTIYIPGRGYVILRFRAGNLGVWFFGAEGLWGGRGMGMGFDVR